MEELSFAGRANDILINVCLMEDMYTSKYLDIKFSQSFRIKFLHIDDSLQVNYLELQYISANGKWKWVG